MWVVLVIDNYLHWLLSLLYFIHLHLYTKCLLVVTERWVTASLFKFLTHCYGLKRSYSYLNLQFLHSCFFITFYKLLISLTRFWVIFYILLSVFILCSTEDAPYKMVIIVGNRLCDMNSKPEWGCFSFLYTLMLLGKVWIHFFFVKQWINSKADRVLLP